MDRLEVILLLVGRQDARLEQLAEAYHSVERSPQLMAHGRQEITLGAVGSLSGFHRGLKTAFALVDIGHIHCRFQNHGQAILTIKNRLKVHNELAIRVPDNIHLIAPQSFNLVARQVAAHLNAVSAKLAHVLSTNRIGPFFGHQCTVARVSDNDLAIRIKESDRNGDVIKNLLLTE